MKYAVRVQLAVDDWIYITEDKRQCDFAIWKTKQDFGVEE
jgi:hypothetical protein